MVRTVKYDATERQLSFIVTLAAERGFTYLSVDKANSDVSPDEAGPTLTKGPTTIDLMRLTKRGASNLIQWLRDQPKQLVAKPKQLATERQVEYLVSLMERRGWTVDGFSATSPQGNLTKLDELSPREASALIDEVKVQPKVSRTPKPNPNVRITEDGMYRLDGEIYKVQVAVHGSQHLYAKRLVIDSPAVRDANGNITQPGAAHYERDYSAMARLLPEHRLTLADAKGFGDLYGVCMRCAATLTDEDSIEAGAGPVCRGKI